MLKMWKGTFFWTPDITTGRACKSFAMPMVMDEKMISILSPYVGPSVRTSILCHFQTIKIEVFYGGKSSNIMNIDSAMIYDKVVVFWRLQCSSDKPRIGTWLLGHSLVRSLAPLTHLLSPHCSLCSHALLRSFIRLLAHFAYSITCRKVKNWCPQIRLLWTTVESYKIWWNLVMLFSSDWHPVWFFLFDHPISKRGTL